MFVEFGPWTSPEAGLMRCLEHANKCLKQAKNGYIGPIKKLFKNHHKLPSADAKASSFVAVTSICYRLRLLDILP